MTPGEELKHVLDKLNIAFCLTTVSILLLKILTGQGSSEQVEALLESAGASSRVADGSSAALSTGSSGGSFSYQDVKTLVYGTLQHLMAGEFQDINSLYLSLTKRRR